MINLKPLTQFPHFQVWSLLSHLGTLLSSHVPPSAFCGMLPALHVARCDFAFHTWKPSFSVSNSFKATYALPPFPGVVPTGHDPAICGIWCNSLTRQCATESVYCNIVC